MPSAPPVVLDPALLQAGEEQLAVFLDPLVRVLLKKHAQGPPEPETFPARLADELSGPHRVALIEAMRRQRGK